MNFGFFIRLMLFFAAFIACYSPSFAAERKDSSANSQVISFFSPSGMNGFIVYDVGPSDKSAGLSYASKSFGLHSPLGLPVDVEVELEGLSISDGSYNLHKLLQGRENNYLEIFSIDNALKYAPKSTLSPLNAGGTDITMVIASASYRASDRFSAKFSTGLSQAMKEGRGSPSPLGYELDLAGIYQIAPGLTFSVGAGYATNTDYFREFDPSADDTRSWTLNSKLRLKF